MLAMRADMRRMSDRRGKSDRYCNGNLKCPKGQIAIGCGTEYQQCIDEFSQRYCDGRVVCPEGQKGIRCGTENEGCVVESVVDKGKLLLSYGGKFRNFRKSRKSRKSRNFRKSRKSRKSRKH